MPPEGVIVRRSAPQHDERTVPAALARFSMRSRRLWCVLAATAAAAGAIVPVASGGLLRGVFASCGGTTHPFTPSGRSSADCPLPHPRVEAGGTGVGRGGHAAAA